MFCKEHVFPDIKKMLHVARSEGTEPKLGTEAPRLSLSHFPATWTPTWDVSS